MIAVLHQVSKQEENLRNTVLQGVKGETDISIKDKEKIQSQAHNYLC